MGTRLSILKRHKERYDNEPGFKEKHLKLSRNWSKRNKERVRLRQKEWRQILSEFRNRKCKECYELLSYRTKGEYCRSHKHLNTIKLYNNMKKGEKC